MFQRSNQRQSRRPGSPDRLIQVRVSTNHDRDKAALRQAGGNGATRGLVRSRRWKTSRTDRQSLSRLRLLNSTVLFRLDAVSALPHAGVGVAARNQPKSGR
jgi:hypothetical protein